MTHVATAEHICAPIGRITECRSNTDFVDVSGPMASGYSHIAVEAA